MANRLITTNALQLLTWYRSFDIKCCMQVSGKTHDAGNAGYLGSCLSMSFELALERTNLPHGGLTSSFANRRLHFLFTQPVLYLVQFRLQLVHSGGLLFQLTLQLGRPAFWLTFRTAL